MNIKKLRGFKAVVTLGSLGSAARVMHLSQPAMSRLISTLEAELRLTLFRREKRRLILTREGSAFYRETERILANLDELPQIINDIKSNAIRRLRIVALARFAESLVSPALAEFLQRLPGQRCSVDVRTRRDMENWVAGRQYDIGVAVSVPCVHPEIVCQPIYSANAMALLPRGHPLAQQKTVSAKDLAPYPFVGLASGLRSRQQSDAIFEAAGLQKSPDIETTSTALACRFVSDGCGFTLVDRLSSLAVRTRRVVLRPVAPAYPITFGLIYPRGHEPPDTLGVFVSCLRKHIDRTLGSSALQ